MGKFIFFLMFYSLKLQIISIYKVTDFAPLFVTVTTAEQRLLGYIYVKLLEWYLFILVIQRSQLTIRVCQFEFSMAVAD